MRVGAINFRSVEINLTIVEDNACTIIIKRPPVSTLILITPVWSFIAVAPLYTAIPTSVLLPGLHRNLHFLEVNDSTVNNHITVTVGGHTGTCVIYSNYTTFRVGRNSVVTSATPVSVPVAIPTP